MKSSQFDGTFLAPPPCAHRTTLCGWTERQPGRSDFRSRTPIVRQLSAESHRPAGGRATIDDKLSEPRESSPPFIQARTGPTRTIGRAASNGWCKTRRCPLRSPGTTEARRTLPSGCSGVITPTTAEPLPCGTTLWTLVFSFAWTNWPADTQDRVAANRDTADAGWSCLQSTGG